MGVRRQPDGMSEANLQRRHRRPGATKSHMTDKKKKESLEITPSFTEPRNHFCYKKLVTKINCTKHKNLLI